MNWVILDVNVHVHAVEAAASFIKVGSCTVILYGCSNGSVNCLVHYLGGGRIGACVCVRERFEEGEGMF